MYVSVAAGPVSVRREADAPANCTHEKGLQIQAFRKRLMGFEPTTFCMASRRSSQLSYSRTRAQYSRGPAPDFAPA
jgi:hypothetical protein